MARGFSERARSITTPAMTEREIFNSSRRAFVRTIATSALGITGAPDTAVAAAARTVFGGRHGRRMIVRADDVGQSVVCNIGAFEAIDRGVVTAADVMLDSPGTVDALEKLRKRPWISTGWHMHMWGKPVLGATTVPSLVEHGGDFDGRFRTDVTHADDISYEEALSELRAQLVRCRRVLGALPDVMASGMPASKWGRAVRIVLDESKIPYNVSRSAPVPERYLKHIADAKARGEAWANTYSAAQPAPAEVDPRWASRKIIAPAGTSAYIDLLTDSISAVEANYDPIRFYTEDRSGILNFPADTITWQAWHPGYIDYYVYRLGERLNRSRAQQFVIGRVQDVAALTSPVLRSWIEAHGIELINFRDALFGTGSYQAHLRAAHDRLAFA